MIPRIICISMLLLPAPACGARPGFELASRSLFQAPARAAAFFEGGAALASGGAVMILPDGADRAGGAVLQLDGEPMSMACSGKTVWAAAGKAGLIGIDVYDPYNPGVSIEVPCGRAVSCAAVDGVLMVVEGGGKVVQFDISGRNSASPVGEPLDLPGASHVTAGPGGFAVSGRDFAVSLEPAGDGPAVVCEADAGEPVSKAVAAGRKLFMLTSSSRVLLGTCEGRERKAIGSGVSDIAACGDDLLALLADGRIARRPAEAEATGEEGPGLRFSIMIEDRSGPSTHFGGSLIACSKKRLAVFSPEGGFELFDVSGDGAKRAGAVAAGGFAIDVTARAGRVYLANGRDGLRIGEVGPDGKVEWTGHVQTDDARDVDIDGNILALADGAAGVKFFALDESKAGQPVLEGGLDSPYYISAVAAREGKAFLAGGLGGAEIVDFSDPSSPRLLWRKEFSEVRGIASDGKYLYIADGFKGFHIYSLDSIPPVRTGGIDTPGWNCDLFVDGDLLYAAEGNRGIMTIDISDRSSPKVLDTVPLGGIAREIHAFDGTLFVASQVNGVNAVDVSDPEDISLAGHFETVDDARGVFADGRFVYLASGSGGLYIFRYTR